MSGRRLADEAFAARKRLATLPGFTPARAEAARLTRLVGMTNRVFKVDADGEVLCLRIPGDGVAARIDRRVEETNARLAAKAGVAPEILYFGADAVMLTRFVEGVPLVAAELSERGGALKRAAAALRELHESSAAFSGLFLPFATIDKYEAALERLGRPLDQNERQAVRDVQEAGRTMAEHPVAPKPCHCDPTGRNLIDTGERVWLIDWEYSGMNDPTWDLAYFSIESRLDEAGDEELLTAYFGRPPSDAETARMNLMKPVAEVQAALWALIQDAEGNPGGDFSGYAKAAFESAGRRMNSDAFRRTLAAL